ncbi:MAG: hypothetical protein R2878_08740 [Thermoleophilia bacterium]
MKTAADEELVRALREWPTVSGTCIPAWAPKLAQPTASEGPVDELTAGT